jgi:hypothetical protein
MSKMERLPSYDKVLQDLEKQYLLLMTKYLSKLHDAFHKDKGLEASHVELVNKIKQGRHKAHERGGTRRSLSLSKLARGELYKANRTAMVSVWYP